MGLTPAPSRGVEAPPRSPEGCPKGARRVVQWVPPTALLNVEFVHHCAGTHCTGGPAPASTQPPPFHVIATWPHGNAATNAGMATLSAVAMHVPEAALKTCIIVPCTSILSPFRVEMNLPDDSRGSLVSVADRLQLYDDT